MTAYLTGIHMTIHLSFGFLFFVDRNPRDTVIRIPTFVIWIPIFVFILRLIFRHPLTKLVAGIPNPSHCNS